jgi:hypothetical protein
MFNTFVSLNDTIAGGGTLASADTAAAAAGEPLLIDKNVSLSANTTLTAELYPGGGAIDCNGHTLTLSQNPTAIDAGLFTVTTAGSAVVLPSHCVSRLAWFNPAGDGTTDDTAAVQAWCKAAYRRYAHAGKFKVTAPSAWFWGTSSPGPVSIVGAGDTVTEFYSSTGASVFNWQGGATATNIYISGALFQGFALTGPGATTGTDPAFDLSVPDNAHGGPGSSSAGYDFHMQRVRVTSFGGPGISAGAAGANVIGNFWFTCRFSEVQCNLVGGDGIEWVGENTLTFINCYMHICGDATHPKAGYRVHGGRYVFIECNGVDNAAYWGVFGLNTSAPYNDPYNSYAHVSLIGCNVESFQVTGLQVRNGVLSCENTTFLAHTAPSTVLAIEHAFPNVVGGGSLRDVSFLTTSAAWTNGYPVQVEHALPWSYVIANGDGTNVNTTRMNGAGTMTVYDKTPATTVVISMLSQTNWGYLRAGLEVPDLNVTDCLKTPSFTLSDLFTYVPAAPQAKDGMVVWATDLGGGAGALFFDNTLSAWKRGGEVSYAARTNTSGTVTLVTLTDAVRQDFAGVTLTGNLAVSFSATRKYKGSAFRIMAPGNLAGFTFTVNLTAGGVTLAAGGSITVVCDGTNWVAG